MRKITGFNTGVKAQRMIQSSLERERFAHAVILEGATAQERLDLAKKIATSLICESDDTAPCGVCKHCRKVFSDSHPDVHIYMPTKGDGYKTLGIRVDDARKIRSDSFVTANEAACRVFIIVDAQLLKIEAQNALLKTIEEPQNSEYFILLCSNRSGFLDTFLSRCVSYIIGDIRQEFKKDSAVAEALEAAKGVAKSWGTSNAFEIVKACGVFDKNKDLFSAMLPFLQDIIVSALRNGYSCEDGDELQNEAQLLRDKKSPEALLAGFDTVGEIITSLAENANLNLALARFAAKLSMI
ncbi:MAG: hypothetical protein K6B52_00390 [Clostridiales bacterium]|nr:hypothetical protein [Clostridiales bacterium]